MVPSKPAQMYQPRVYGFRVNESSAYYTKRDDVMVRNPSNTQKNSADTAGNDRSSRRTRRTAAGSGRK